MGDHLDIVSHYVHETVDSNKNEFLTCCWLREEEDAILAIGGTCQQIYILSVSRSRVIQVLSGHQGFVIDLVAHPLRKDLLFSVGQGDTVRIWNWKSGHCIHIIELNAISLAINPKNGEDLFIAGTEGSIHRWEFPKEKWNFLPAANSSLSTSSWKTSNIPLTRDVPAIKKQLHGTTVDSIVFVNNDLVLSKSINGKIELWNADTYEIVKSFHLKGSSGNNYCRLDVGQDGVHFCVGDGNGGVHIFDLNTGKQVAELKHKRSKHPIRSCVFNHNSRNLIYGGCESLIWRYDYIDEQTLSEWAQNKPIIL